MRPYGVVAVSVSVGSGDLTADELAGTPPLGAAFGLTADMLADQFTRRLGAGAVVYLPTSTPDWPELARIIIEQPSRFLAGAQVPYPPLKPSPPGLFLTRFRDGSALLLNTADKAAQVTYEDRQVSVPGQGLAEVRP